jgi:predicted GIY-YIG superfamily endonuclease
VFRQANLLKQGVDPSRMSIGALKQHLRALGISCDGMLEKSELVARLNTACLATGSGAAQTNDSTLPPAETASSSPLPARKWIRPTPPVMTEEEAHRLAKEEGISLVLAPGNASGYKGVSRNNSEARGFSPKSGYCAQFCQDGKTVRLGSFSGAPEAALAYARHLKVVTARKKQELREQSSMRRPPFQGRTSLPGRGDRGGGMRERGWLHALQAHHQGTHACAPAGTLHPHAHTSPPAHPTYYPPYVPTYYVPGGFP